MMSDKKTARWLKNGLIAVLTFSALLLGWQTHLFNEFFNSIPLFRSAAELFKGTPGTAEDIGPATKEAARPVCIVITSGAGGHYGVKYNTDVINTLYVRMSGILGEALSPAGSPVEVTEETWRTALLSQGIYFEYVNPVKLSVLSGWFGSRSPAPDGGIALRRVCVSLGDDMNRLYFQDDETGRFYKTDAGFTGGRSVDLRSYIDNGAVFAFETELEAAKKAPYMLLMPGNEHPVIRVLEHTEQQELLDTILIALGASNQIKPSYPAADGALVYVGAGFTIRVWTDGRASLARTGDLSADTEAAEIGEGELIEKARSIVADTIGQNCGDAEVHFDNAKFNEDGTYTVTFYYRAAGGRIFTGDGGYAAGITFTESVITALELNFKSYDILDETALLPPERQAFAAAGGGFMLYYEDRGSERLWPAWAKTGGVINGV